MKRKNSGRYTFAREKRAGNDWFLSLIQWNSVIASFDSLSCGVSGCLCNCMLASFPGPTQSLVHGERLGTRCVKCINYLQVHVRLFPHYAFLNTCKLCTWWCMYPQYWVFTRHTLIFLPSHRKPSASCALHSPAWLRASIVRRGGWRSCGKHTSLHWHLKRPSSRNWRICCVSKRSRSDSWRPVWGVTYPPPLSRLAETKDLLHVFV